MEARREWRRWLEGGEDTESGGGHGSAALYATVSDVAEYVGGGRAEAGAGEGGGGAGVSALVVNLMEEDYLVWFKAAAGANESGVVWSDCDVEDVLDLGKFVLDVVTWLTGRSPSHEVLLVVPCA